MHNRYEQYPGLYGTVVPVLEYHTLYDAYPGRVHCCCCVFTVYSIFAMSWTTMQCDGAGLANGTYPGRFRFRLVRFRGVLGADIQ